MPDGSTALLALVRLLGVEVGETTEMRASEGVRASVAFGLLGREVHAK